MAQPQRRYSVDDYFAVEADSAIKHDFYNGEIFAMAGASLAHNEITANVLALLRTALRGGRRRAYASDLRLATPGGLYTYPDVMVICGRAKMARDRPDTVLNPILLAEILSEATQEYDRGEKFDLYKEIPTLRHYLLIAQDEVRVDHFQRTTRRTWGATLYRRRDAVLTLASLRVQLPLNEIYRGVDL